MSERIEIPDQADVLADNERLTAENLRLNADLTAANELLETAQQQTLEAAERADFHTQHARTLETAARVAGEELARVQAENTDLRSRQSDFQRAVAAEVQKLGLRPKAAEHKEAPSDADLTPTQRVLAAKGVSSIAELTAARA